MTPSCKSVVSYAIFNVSSTNSRKEEGTKPIHAFPQHAVTAKSRFSQTRVDIPLDSR